VALGLFDRICAANVRRIGKRAGLRSDGRHGDLYIEHGAQSHLAFKHPCLSRVL
jgi:hypothetical protein